MAELGHSFSLGTSLETRLSPHMQQALKMLQMSALDLGTELRQQMAANPAIEDVRDPRESLLSVAAPENKATKTAADPDVELDFTPDGEAAANILGADDGRLDYFLGGMESASSDEEEASRRQRLFDTVHTSVTLQEHLLSQVSLADFPNKEDCQLAEILIGNIADSGQFIGSYPDIEMATGADERRLESVRRRILKFDPVGCGWKDPRECLIAQLDKLDDSPWQGDVRKLIVRHFEDVAAGRHEAVREQLGLSQEDYAQALAALRSLSPRPGNDKRFVAARERAEYVHPEVHAVRKDGRWIAEVESRGLPEIHISPKYLKLAKDPKATPEARAFAAERIRAAEQLIEAIENRQETIRNIAQSIIDEQPDFFERGLSALRPMTQRTIAEKVKVHDTTVSRTVRDKYMTTPFGTLSLRRFFVSGVETADGGTMASTAVHDLIRRLVDAEDKAHPLSDEIIVKELQAKGVKVARRTVSKYREQLGIPSAAGRRAKV